MPCRARPRRVVLIVPRGAAPKDSPLSYNLLALPRLAQPRPAEPRLALPRLENLFPRFNVEFAKDASECAQPKSATTLLKQVENFLFLDFFRG